MVRRMTDLPPPVPALTRTCGDSASRSTETILPPRSRPISGADSGTLSTRARMRGSDAGVGEDHLRRRLLDLPGHNVGLAPLTGPAEGSALPGELLGDRLHDGALVEPEGDRRVERMTASSSLKFLGTWR
ncbi:hypothetical protein GCM10010302_06310 [Streptomyces polychromogenes]|uniref:Uncharacterized protein n=1 Tax=Streptomyces polychromogenes TaxID=67342 RepID=A0ABP3ENH9_9ACTN